MADKLQISWDLPQKLLVTGSSLLALGSALYYFYGPPKHSQVPNINAPYSWLTGHAGWLIKADNDNCLMEIVHDAFNATSDKYQQCVNMSIPFDNCRIFTCDPEILEFVFTTEFESFGIGHKVREIMDDFLGNGIFTSDAPEWTFHRKITSKIFAFRNLKEHMFKCALTGSKRAIQKLKELNTLPKYEKEGIDMVDMFSRYTLDCILEISFGKHTDMIEMAPEQHHGSKAFRECFELTAHRFLDPFWKFKKELNIGNEKLLRETRASYEDFIEDLLDLETRKKLLEEQQLDPHDIVSLYLSIDPEISKKQLRDITCHMLVAGSDTTRSLLTWVLYAIENKPDIIQKIKDEIADIDVDDFSYEHLSTKLRYTECVILETLRLYPSVVWTLRSARKDVTIPNKNLTFKKGDTLMVLHAIMGRSKSIWGEDVLVFNPMRWYDNLINTKSTYDFLHFGMLPRICLGRPLALMETKLFLLVFLKNFEFKAVHARPTSKDHKEDQKITVPYTCAFITQITSYPLHLTPIQK